MNKAVAYTKISEHAKSTFIGQILKVLQPEKGLDILANRALWNIILLRVKF